MRLFVAIELEPAVRTAIAAAQTTLRPLLASGGAELRWTPPDQMHLTLAFIGHVDAPGAAAIQAACGRPVPMDPFEIDFGGCGVFPPRGAPRVLWLGIARGGGMLLTLQGLVAGRLTSAGVMLDTRPYHPHVTLARWKAPRAADARRVRGLQAGSRTIRARVEGVTLFESRPSPTGSVYTPLSRGRLTGAHGQPLQ